MPLLDHFHPPLQPHHHWESFHSNWATRIADILNERWLPPDFLAEESTHAGARVEIDVGAFERIRGEPSQGEPGVGESGRASGVATLRHATWSPPAPMHTIAGVLPDNFEVRVFSTAEGLRLVGAVELISPGNKDRYEERRAFAIKCASYLHQGVSVAIIDIVTNRRANLHRELLRLLETDEQEAGADAQEADESNLYAAAYRPVLRGERPEIDLWTAEFAVGQPLPVMPLALTGDLFVPVDFDASYQEACRRRRLA